MKPVHRLLGGSLADMIAGLLGGAKYCPVCGNSVRRFLPFGIPPRPGAMCPECGSLERHRLLWLYFKHETDLFRLPVKKMLHVAPERCFERRFMELASIDYLSADISGEAMIKMDVMDIQYPDDSFDIIYCSHVLEHVADDIRAMKEFARVLKPSGWAVLQVPIDADRTFEDPSVTDPAERERLFGQYDHLRIYGPDYKDRLEKAGFVVKVEKYRTRFDDATLNRYGMMNMDEDIYICGLR